ncbi:MAG: DUF5652 family protein [Candidatus Nanoarchaeia archaeon]|nr:DUF5652 family protein [Candidatus Nanoarchaeia archaeon]MDD5741628.1 DUF5652 family protein [Candidatus Nanoarchaeia archaeon]
MVDASALISGTTTDPYTLVSNLLGVSLLTAIIILAVISIWSLVWKGFALWKASKKDQMVWFIVLLVVNTFGILEILYIYIFSKMSLKGKGKTKKR